MTSEDIQMTVFLLLFCLVLCPFAVRSWQLHLARKRMVRIVNEVAQRDRNVIRGQPVEYWLNILNQNDAQRIVVVLHTAVLTYRGHEYFFVDGTTRHAASSLRPHDMHGRAFFLVAVDQSAVRLLSQEEHLFRLITGSTQLAVFSISRWPEFTNILEFQRHLLGYRDY